MASVKNEDRLSIMVCPLERCMRLNAPKLQRQPTTSGKDWKSHKKNSKRLRGKRQQQHTSVLKRVSFCGMLSSSFQFPPLGF